MCLCLIANFSHQFNPDDDYYDPPKYNDDVLHPAPIILGEDDSGCICREVPNLHTLCFGRSKCDKLPINIKISTKVLSIVNTHIPEIQQGDLDELNFLIDLKIEGNYNMTRISPGVFENFTKLENLSISFNPNLKTLHEDTFVGLDNLKQLFLTKNGFTNLYDITLSLTPITLPKLLKLSLNENKFVNIFENDFAPMADSSLEELDLILCRLEYLHPNCLIPLNNLQGLRIGENLFNASTISRVLKKVVNNKIPLKLLNLYSAGFRGNLPKKLLEVISVSNISHLNLAKNQFEIIPSGAFPAMPNLRTLDLKEGLISDIADDAFVKLTNLESLILSENVFSSLPKGALLKQLKKLDFQQNSGTNTKASYFEMNKGVFSNMTNLEHLNLNSNNLVHLFRGSFEGLINLKELFLSKCTIYHIESKTFTYVRNLTFLNLENNYFFLNYPSGLSEDIFDGLEKLEVLLLGENKIEYLSKKGNPFWKLKSLKTLGLEGNRITSLDPKQFFYSTQLEYLDLSYNLFKSWQERIFTENFHLRILLLDHNKLTYFTPSMLEDFSNLTRLTLAYNSLNCDCLSYQYFKEYADEHDEDKIVKILKSADSTCLTPYMYSNHVVYNAVDYFKHVENGFISCDIDQRIIILLPLILLVLLFITLAMLLFYYRWHLKYWMFLARLHLSRNRKIEKKPDNPKCNFEYDAFVSYSAEDRNFVVRLVAMLENHEPFLKLCVYERDFHAGKFISDCVLKCIAKSRKTVLVISDNYAKSQWCRWESSIAEHHRLFFEKEDGEYVDDALVLVKLGPVNKRHMTPMLRYLLKTRIYLEWNADEKKQKVFWKKLRSTLAPSQTEEFLSEITHM